MRKILHKGDEVLVFNLIYYNIWEATSLIKPTTNGIIERDLHVENLLFGSRNWVDYYYVIGDNGKKYEGSYKYPSGGNAFFYTKEDYLEYLKFIIKENNKQIIKLRENNGEIEEYIESFINDNYYEQAKGKKLVLSKYARL